MLQLPPHQRARVLDFLPPAESARAYVVAPDWLSRERRAAELSVCLASYLHWKLWQQPAGLWSNALADAWLREEKQNHDSQSLVCLQRRSELASEEEWKRAARQLLKGYQRCLTVGPLWTAGVVLSQDAYWQALGSALNQLNSASAGAVALVWPLPQALPSITDLTPQKLWTFWRSVQTAGKRLYLVGPTFTLSGQYRTEQFRVDADVGCEIETLSLLRTRFSVLRDGPRATHSEIPWKLWLQGFPRLRELALEQAAAPAMTRLDLQSCGALETLGATGGREMAIYVQEFPELANRQDPGPRSQTLSVRVPGPDALLLHLIRCGLHTLQLPALAPQKDSLKILFQECQHLTGLALPNLQEVGELSLHAERCQQFASLQLPLLKTVQALDIRVQGSPLLSQLQLPRVSSVDGYAQLVFSNCPSLGSCTAPKLKEVKGLLYLAVTDCGQLTECNLSKLRRAQRIHVQVANSTPIGRLTTFELPQLKWVCQKDATSPGSGLSDDESKLEFRGDECKLEFWGGCPWLKSCALPVLQQTGDLWLLFGLGGGIDTLMRGPEFQYPVRHLQGADAGKLRATEGAGCPGLSELWLPELSHAGHVWLACYGCEQLTTCGLPKLKRAQSLRVLFAGPRPHQPQLLCENLQKLDFQCLQDAGERLVLNLSDCPALTECDFAEVLSAQSVGIRVQACGLLKAFSLPSLEKVGGLPEAYGTPPSEAPWLSPEISSPRSPSTPLSPEVTTEEPWSPGPDTLPSLEGQCTLAFAQGCLSLQTFALPVLQSVGDLRVLFGLVDEAGDGNLTCIKDAVFPKLSQLQLPALTSVRSLTLGFYKCEVIKKLELPKLKEVERIVSVSCRNCPELEKFALPELRGSASLCKLTFTDCKRLAACHVPNLKKASDVKCRFSGCPLLTVCELPAATNSTELVLEECGQLALGALVPEQTKASRLTLSVSVAESKAPEAVALPATPLGLPSVTTVESLDVTLTRCHRLTFCALDGFKSADFYVKFMFEACKQHTELRLPTLGLVERSLSLTWKECKLFRSCSLTTLARVGRLEVECIGCPQLPGFVLPKLHSVGWTGGPFADRGQLSLVFEGCSNLAKIDLPELEQVEGAVQLHASNCPELVSISLPKLSAHVRCDIFLKQCGKLAEIVGSSRIIVKTDRQFTGVPAGATVYIKKRR